LGWSLRFWSLRFWSLRFWSLRFWSLRFWSLRFWSLRLVQHRPHNNQQERSDSTYKGERREAIQKTHASAFEEVPWQ